MDLKSILNLSDSKQNMRTAPANQTINEEAGLPDNWVPVERPPIVPASAPQAGDEGSSRYLQGSLPPGYQHDTSFVGTSYRASNTPLLSLMPLGLQGNPSNNAAIQSTSKLTASSGSSVAPAAAALGDGLIHGDVIWDVDSAFVNVQEDFLWGPQGLVTGSSTPTWKYPWTCNMAAVNGIALAGGIGGMQGYFVIPASGNADEFSVVAPGGSGDVQGTNGYNNAWPLFETPSWKIVQIFKFAPPFAIDVTNTTSVPAFSMAQVSFYMGLGASPQNLGTPSTGISPVRPPVFCGLRYDTDTTSPSIGDTTFHFECKLDQTLGTTRDNTQGNVFDTGITPTEGVEYRFEMTCTATGSIIFSLTDGTQTVSSTLAMPTWVSTSGGYVAIINNLGIPEAIGISGTAFAAGNIVTVSGCVTGTTLNGVWTATGAGSDIGLGWINFPLVGSLASTSEPAMVMSGYPAVFPWLTFGNSSAASPVLNRTALWYDYIGYIWNPGVAGTTSATPNPTLPRYF